jgi:hypothetical protein
MQALLPDDRLEVIDHDECLRLLREGQVGRLGFLADGTPRIEPVNYVVADGAVIVVSRPGTKLDAVAGYDAVAFEIDAVEEWAQAGWSVLVCGRATVVPLRDLPSEPDAPLLQPWAPVSDAYLIRIDIDEVTGRRVRTDPGRVSVVHAG